MSDREGLLLCIERWRDLTPEMREDFLNVLEDSSLFLSGAIRHITQCETKAEIIRDLCAAVRNDDRGEIARLAPLCKSTCISAGGMKGFLHPEELLDQLKTPVSFEYSICSKVADGLWLVENRSAHVREYGCWVSGLGNRRDYRGRWRRVDGFHHFVHANNWQEERSLFYQWEGFARKWALQVVRDLQCGAFAGGRDYLTNKKLPKSHPVHRYQHPWRRHVDPDMSFQYSPGFVQYLRHHAARVRLHEREDRAKALEEKRQRDAERFAARSRQARDVWRDRKIDEAPKHLKKVAGILYEVESGLRQVRKEMRK